VKTAKAASARENRKRMRTVFIGMGSNMGDRLEHLSRARSAMMNAAGLPSVRQSSIYETAPVGKLDQADFLNAVTEFQTDLAPDELLKILQQVEFTLGRLRLERWGPRTIDLDILCIQGVVRRKSPRLRLPHAELAGRRFVLVPWAEIAPDFFVEGYGRTVQQLLNECPDQSRVVAHTPATHW
jgi:2-amino-4-hydroxy-6-hydroxymethyldihydropteridine diphosphokinase